MANILHLNTTRDWRGGDMQMLTIYQLLQQQPDIQQTIFCPQDSKIAQQLEAQAIPYLATIEKHKLSFNFFRAVLKIAKANKITIVHAHDSYALTIATVVSLFCKNLHIIYSRKRDNRINTNFFKQLKFNNKRLRKIVCVSHAVKTVFEKAVRDNQKIAVIYDGINVEHFASQQNKGVLRKEFKLAQDTLIIGNIAALKPEKDLKTFIDAAAIALQKTSRSLFFLVAGDGPLKLESSRTRFKPGSRKMHSD